MKKIAKLCIVGIFMGSLLFVLRNVLAFNLGLDSNSLQMLQKYLIITGGVIALILAIDAFAELLIKAKKVSIKEHQYKNW